MVSIRKIEWPENPQGSTSVQPQRTEQQECGLCEQGFPLNDNGDHTPTQSLGMIPVTRCRKLPQRTANTCMEEICKAHIAALAAEQEQHHQLSIYLEGNPYSDPDFMADSRALKAAIKLKEQLLHALASIEKYKKAMDDLYNHNEAVRHAVIQHMGTIHPTLDLSALHQHDAEVRKPLVEALEEAANDCEEVSRDTSIGHGERRAWIAVARKLRSALAKVKEGSASAGHP